MSRLGFPLEDPVRLDELIRQGAKAMQRAAPGPDKQLANALGVTRTRANRAKNGDKHSHATRYLQPLAEADAVNAIPLLAEGLAVVFHAQIEEACTDELEKRLRKIAFEELTVDRERNSAHLRFLEGDRTPEQHDEVAEWDMRRVDLALERAGIHRELAKRKRRVARAR